MPLAATPKLLTTICSAAVARSGSSTASVSAAMAPGLMIEDIRPPVVTSLFVGSCPAAVNVAYGVRSLRHAPMESMVDDDEQCAHRRGEQHDQQRHRHDQLHVLQAVRGHNRKADAVS